MKAAIYARVSTEEQTQNFSIQNQLERLVKYCDDKAYTVGERYVDGGYSGTIADRPALNKLMNDARNGIFNIILVYKLDRLFRNNKHMYNTIAEWEELGIEFTSVTESFDTTTAMGKAYLGMASTFAEWERNTFIERSRDGRRKAIQNGYYSGGMLPYGFRQNVDTRKLEIDEEEAEIVRKIFYWLNEERMSCYSIANRLNAMGVPTRYRIDGRLLKGKATANIWRGAGVYNMLRNSVYKGVWVYGKRAKNPQQSQIEVEVPAIVDDHTFDKALIRFKENNVWADRNSKQLYILRGLVKCELCGSTFGGCSTATKQGQRRYYRCNGRVRHEAPQGRCNAMGISADLIENLIWNHISRLVQNPAVVKGIVQNKLTSIEEDNCESEIIGAKNRIEELMEAEKRLLSLYADPRNKFSKEALDTELEGILSSRELIEQRLRDLIETRISEKEQRDRLENINYILSKLRNRVKKATPEIKQQVIQSLVLEAKVGKDCDGKPTLKIIYAFDDKVEKKVGLQSSRIYV